MLFVIFEVIQPDLEIDRRHALALVMLHTGRECARRFGQCGGGIRANSGKRRWVDAPRRSAGARLLGVDPHIRALIEEVERQHAAIQHFIVEAAEIELRPQFALRALA